MNTETEAGVVYRGGRAFQKRLDGIRDHWLQGGREPEGDLAAAARRDIGFLDWLLRHMSADIGDSLERILYYDDGPTQAYGRLVKWVLTCAECRKKGVVDPRECKNCTFLVEPDHP